MTTLIVFAVWRRRLIHGGLLGLRRRIPDASRRRFVGSQAQAAKAAQRCPDVGRLACSARRSACVLRTTVGLRAPHDGRLACSARRSACVLRTTVGLRAPHDGRLACSARRSACVLRTTVGLRAPHDGRLACSARRSACVLRTTVGLRAPHDGRLTGPPAAVRIRWFCDVTAEVYQCRRLLEPAPRSPGILRAGLVRNRLAVGPFLRAAVAARTARRTACGTSSLGHLTLDAVSLESSLPTVRSCRQRTSDALFER